MRRMATMRVRIIWRCACASCGDHTIVLEERLDAGLAPAERGEGFRCRAAAAHREDLVAEPRSGFRIENAVFFKEAVRVGGQDFRPLVAVVARGIAAEIGRA